MIPNFGRPSDFIDLTNTLFNRYKNKGALTYIEHAERDLNDFLKRRCKRIGEDVLLVPRNRTLPDGFFQYVSVFYLPFNLSSYDFMPEEDGFVETITSSPSIFRLNGVSQLAFVLDYDSTCFTTVEMDFNSRLHGAYEHTRYHHSLLVMMLMHLVLTENGITGKEYVNGVIAALLHDIATPALGDTAKYAIPGLDEEANFLRFFQMYENEEQWKLRVPEFSISLINSYVNGEGLIGKILDACDKIAYVSLDTCYHGERFAGEIRDYINSNPLICDIIWDIKVTPDREDIYFTSPERLKRFLHLRALEFKNMLLEPSRKIGEAYIKKLLGQAYKEGSITAEEFLQFDDAKMSKRMIDIFGYNALSLHTIFEGYEYRVCEYYELDQIESEIKATGSKVLCNMTFGSFNPGTYFLTLDSHGEIKPFSQAKPLETSLLKQAAKDTIKTSIYFIPPQDQ